MIQGDRPDEPQAEIIETTGAGRPLGPIGGGSSRSLLAIVGLVVVLGLAGLAVLTSVGRSSPVAPLPSHAALVPSGPPTVGPLPSVAATAAGLPIVGVNDALNALSADPASQAEVAVRGWYTASRQVATCQPTLEPVGTCASAWSAALESRPDALWSGDGSVPATPPGTSVINLLLLDPVLPPDLATSLSGPTLEVIAPSPLVLLGHFNDERLTACAGSGPRSCGSVLVVDALADATGLVATDVPNIDVPSTAMSVASVSGVIRANLKPGGYVLSFGAVAWSSGLPTQTVVEPSAVGPPPDGRTVWLVRGYLGAGTAAPVASWLAIDDTSGQIWGPLARVPAVQPLGGDFPATIDGLPVESVSAALARGADQGGLTAVGGYLSNDRAVEGCPPAPTTDKPNPCSGTRLVLVDQASIVLQANDATFLYDIVVPPGAASIQPVVLPGTTVADPWAGATTIGDRLKPKRVILLGQFGDPRAPDCAPRPGGGNAGCDRSLVVDQIAWIEGVAQAASESSDPGASSVRPAHDRTDVSLAVAGWFLPGETPAIVSITSTLPGDAVALTGVNLDGRPNGLYWVVLVVSTPPAGPTGTFLVFDDRTMNLVEVSSGG